MSQTSTSSTATPTARRPRAGRRATATRSRSSAPARAASPAPATWPSAATRSRVFEALHKCGGVLAYGIPEFRLPKSIVDREVKNLEAYGVKFVNDCIIGRTMPLDQLFEDGFEAVFIGSGAGPAAVPEHPGREPAGRLQRQRVPHPHQPHEGLPRRLRHADKERRQAHSRRRRRQRRHGRRPLRQAHGRGRGLVVYPPRRNELPARAEGDPPRRGGGHRVPPAQ